MIPLTTDKLFSDAQVGYTYDDILLVPQYSTINSRLDVDLSVDFAGTELKIPILAAPMDTICGVRMCHKMYECGGMGILHRFFPSREAWEDELRRIIDCVPFDYRAAAIGVNKYEYEGSILKLIVDNFKFVCIDVNIGHHEKVINLIKWLKKEYPHLKVIAGNVSTYEGARDLCDAGADVIRATNGFGSACSTLIVTGVGVPTATSLYECYRAVRRYKDKFLIADGGHKNSGSMVKALAIGADVVMIGGLLAGSSACPETAFFEENGEYKAKYYGMASEEAQKVRWGDLKIGTAPEGVSYTIHPRGKTRVILERLAGGIRSGCSFCNARTVYELRRNARWIIRCSTSMK